MEKLARALELSREFADKYPGDFRGWQLLCDLQIDCALDIPASNDTQPRITGTNDRESVKVSIEHMVVLAKTLEETEYLANLKGTVAQVQLDASAFVDRNAEKVETTKEFCDKLDKQATVLHNNNKAIEKELSEAKGKASSDPAVLACNSRRNSGFCPRRKHERSMGVSLPPPWQFSSPISLSMHPTIQR